MKKVFFMLLFLTVWFFSCKKQEMPDAKFTFTAILQSSNHVMLNWSAVKLAEFKNITIYRSTSPIPDPTFQTPIDGNLIVNIITDKTVTSFVDSSFTVSSNGNVYYKLVVNLTNRFITSEQGQISLDAFSVILPNNNQFGSSFTATRFPEINAIYAVNFNQGTISLIDYSQKKITATANFSSNSGTSLYPVINNGNPELFVALNNTEIACYDALTLTQKYVVYATTTFTDFSVRNGFLYTIGQYGYVTTYNLSTKTQVNQIVLPSSNSSFYNSGLFTSNSSNQLYIKYFSQYSNYVNGVNVNIYKNMLISYTLVNSIPSTLNNQNIAAINVDSLNSNNQNNLAYIQLSTDGKYISCNQNGDIYSLSNNTTHNIRSSNNFSPYSSFSDDGKYVLGKATLSGTNSNFINSALMDVYALPGFNLVTSLKTLNTGAFSFADDFMDNDSLISYNISQSFISGQTSNALTVLFKKID
jgi:hypothetical protein